MHSNTKYAIALDVAGALQKWVDRMRGAGKRLAVEKEGQENAVRRTERKCAELLQDRPHGGYHVFWDDDEKAVCVVFDIEDGGAYRAWLHKGEHNAV